MQSVLDGLKRARLSRTAAGAAVAGLGLASAMQPTPGLFGVAALLALAGALIRFWSAGIIAKGVELATSGPYAYVRNPLYLGSLLVAVAFVLLNGNPWFGVPAAVGWLVVYHRTIRSEEEVLSARFGEAFAAYRARVPVLIPWKGRCDVPGAGTTYSLEQSITNKEYAGALGTLGMLVVFYAYMNWVDPVPFRVTTGGIALLIVAFRVVRRGRHRAAQEAQEAPEGQEGDDTQAPQAARAAAAGATPTEGADEGPDAERPAP